jgi:rfaE bifunctional protein kinase chain/domain
MISATMVEQILERLPSLRIGVLGDLFLDRYLDIDGSLTEPSLETGLDAYQVVRVRSYPGAAGTVINNLVAMGVGKVLPIAVIGDDGEGYELSQALQRLWAVDAAHVIRDPARCTPTYTKPMLSEKNQPPRELSRLDIKNRQPLTTALESSVLDGLTNLWGKLDALLVLDQVSEPDCGVVTDNVRRSLQTLAEIDPKKWVLVDSRERIGLFRAASLKPNQAECLRASGKTTAESGVLELAQRAGRPVFCTLAEKGILVAQPELTVTQLVPTVQVTGPIDPVGAGDSASAGLACALACGVPAVDAAAFGNLIASITIKQLGTTGTATPDQIRSALYS